MDMEMPGKTITQWREIDTCNGIGVGHCMRMPESQL